MTKRFTPGFLSTNSFLLGLFLLVWSMNGYFIGGDSLKTLLLFLGFIILVVSTLTLKFDVRMFNFFLKTLVILLIYWGIAFINDQKTLDKVTLIFDIVCLVLLNCGYVISKNIKYFAKVSPKLVFFICFLTIIGAYLFIKFQAAITAFEGVEGGRVSVKGDDNSVNAIGLAYVNSIMFFIFFNLLTSFRFKFFLRCMLWVSIFCCLFVIFSASARGALLFIVVVMLLKYSYKFKSAKSLFSFAINFVIISIALVLITKMLFVIFPVIEGKFMKSMDRFQSLFDSVNSSNKSDASSNVRLHIYNNFFENLDNFILFGEEKYHVYPHNQLMEIIQRWGLFFGGVLLFFNISNFFKGITILVKKIETSPLQSLFALTLVFSFLQSMTSMSLEMNRIMWLSLGVIYGVSLKEDKKQEFNDYED